MGAKKRLTKKKKKPEDWTDAEKQQVQEEEAAEAEVAAVKREYAAIHTKLGRRLLHFVQAREVGGMPSTFDPARYYRTCYPPDRASKAKHSRRTHHGSKALQGDRLGRRWEELRAVKDKWAEQQHRIQSDSAVIAAKAKEEATIKAAMRLTERQYEQQMMASKIREARIEAELAAHRVQLRMQMQEEAVHVFIDQLSSAGSSCRKIVFVENAGDEADYKLWSKKLMTQAEYEVFDRSVKFYHQSGRLTYNDMLLCEKLLLQQRQQGDLPELADVLFIIDRDIFTKHEWASEQRQWDKWSTAGGWIKGGVKAYHRTSARSLENYLFSLDPLLQKLQARFGSRRVALQKLHTLLFATEYKKSPSIVDQALCTVTEKIQDFLRRLVNDTKGMKRDYGVMLADYGLNIPGAGSDFKRLAKERINKPSFIRAHVDDWLSAQGLPTQEEMSPSLMNPTKLQKVLYSLVNGHHVLELACKKEMLDDLRNDKKGKRGEHIRSFEDADVPEDMRLLVKKLGHISAARSATAERGKGRQTASNDAQVAAAAEALRGLDRAGAQWVKARLHQEVNQIEAERDREAQQNSVAEKKLEQEKVQRKDAEAKAAVVGDLPRKVALEQTDIELLKLDAEELRNQYLRSKLLQRKSTAQNSSPALQPIEGQELDSSMLLRMRAGAAAGAGAGAGGGAVAAAAAGAPGSAPAIGADSTDHRILGVICSFVPSPDDGTGHAELPGAERLAAEEQVLERVNAHIMQPALINEVGSQMQKMNPFVVHIAGNNQYSNNGPRVVGFAPEIDLRPAADVTSEELADLIVKSAVRGAKRQGKQCNLSCVILNACDSQDYADAIVSLASECKVVYWPALTNDFACLQFSDGFYAGYKEEQWPTPQEGWVERCFEQGKMYVKRIRHIELNKEVVRGVSRVEEFKPPKLAGSRVLVTHEVTSKVEEENSTTPQLHYFDSEEELRCFVRFQRVYRNLLPLAEEALFKKRWLERYPQRNADGSFKYEWSAAMGATFIDGTQRGVDVVLPGSFTAVRTKAVVVRATGQKAKLVQNPPTSLDAGTAYAVMIAGASGPAQDFDGAELDLDGCVSKLAVSDDLTALLSAGDWIRVDGKEVEVKEVKWTAHEKCVKLNERNFAGAPGTYTAVAKLRSPDISPVTQRNGKAIDRHILAKLRQGDLSQWDSTAFFTALCGCSHELLPAPMEVSEYQTKVEAGTPVSAEEEQAFRLDQKRIIRNKDDGHKSRTRMSTTRFVDVIEEAQHFIQALLEHDQVHRDRLLARLQEIENEEVDEQRERARIAAERAHSWKQT